MNDARLFIQTISTPLGDFRVATGRDVVAVVVFPESEGFEEDCRRWLDSRPDAPPASEEFAEKVAERFAAYFAGDVRALDGIPSDPAVPDPSRRVLQAVARIPAGETRAYSDIARELGYGALGPRFVGSVNARNPIPMVIPCHRVIGKDGSLVGYGGRLDRKAWLLAWERHHTQGSEETNS